MGKRKTCMVRQTTRLEASAERVWQTLLQVSTFFYVTRGLLGYGIAVRPEETFAEGRVFRGRLWFGNVVPGWLHQLQVNQIDGARHEITTCESGGPLRVWKHRLMVEPESAGSCWYTDEIEFDAGRLTLPTWIVVQAFFRYRQARWRKLARQIG